MAHYEIEIKSLLGDHTAAHSLKQKMQEMDPSMHLTSRNNQLNHYFEGGSIEVLAQAIASFLNEEQQQKLTRIVEKGRDISVRTRQKDDEVLLVLKASVDGGTSFNTVSRLEFEESIPLSLEALDQIVLDSGYGYQAKWSREREEYAYKDMTVCIDRNAGYGYLAEFEKMTNDEALVPSIRAEIEECMSALGVVELSQERLARMFAHYNANWQEYYGTDNIFTIT